MVSFINYDEFIYSQIPVNKEVVQAKGVLQALVRL